MKNECVLDDSRPRMELGDESHKSPLFSAEEILQNYICILSDPQKESKASAAHAQALAVLLQFRERGCPDRESLLRTLQRFGLARGLS
jgi:hypothetical protein